MDLFVIPGAGKLNAGEGFQPGSFAGQEHFIGSGGGIMVGEAGGGKSGAFRKGNKLGWSAGAVGKNRVEM